MQKYDVHMSKYIHYTAQFKLKAGLLSGGERKYFNINIITTLYPLSYFKEKTM
jgi:hypothetical protein